MQLARRRRRRTDWNGRYQQCVNCHSVRLERRDWGYCERCFPVALRLHFMKMWDPDDVRTWKGCPYRHNDLAFTFLAPRTYVEYCEQRWNGDLMTRRYVEEMIRGEMPIDGVTMEVMFQSLAGALHISKDRLSFHGWANSFDWDLGANGKSLVYRIVDDLLSVKRNRASPWIVAWWEASELDRKKRHAKAPTLDASTLAGE